MSFRMLVVTILLYVNCFSLSYLTSLCVLFVCVFVLMYICIYTYCCFRYLNGVCPIRDDHCGHQNTPHNISHCAGIVMTATSSSSLVPNSHIVYCLRQGIASGCVRIILLMAILLPLLLTQPISWLSKTSSSSPLLLGEGKAVFWDQTDTEKRTRRTAYTHRNQQSTYNTHTLLLLNNLLAYCNIYTGV